MDKERMQELLAKARATATAAVAEKIDTLAAENAAGVDIDVSRLGIVDASDEAADIIKDVLDDTPVREEHESTLGVARTDIVYNDKQQQLIDLVASGADCVLVGAAGTGKTTCQRGTITALIDTGRIPKMTESTKWLQSGLYGAIVVSYTRKAVNNIRHAMPDFMKPHTLTIHKVLEFAPIYYQVEDPANPGQFKNTMRFEPQRNRLNPLPSSLQFIGFEESSMVSKDPLHDQLMDAMPHKHQKLYIGDIQQLPPIFGSAILGYKMLELPVIELTEVYRQALDSPIIRLAWDILRGDPKKFSSTVTKKEKVYNAAVKKDLERISVGALDAFNEEGKLKIHYLQKKISSDLALVTLTKQFNNWSDEAFYNPQEDIILIPFNKAFGTIELNKGIMQHLGVNRDAMVHEIIAGFNKHYLAIGDRVLFDKEDAFIVSINKNAEYSGANYQPASNLLDRWGYKRERENADSEHKVEKSEETDDRFDLEAIDAMLSSAANANEDRVNQASHVITVVLAHTDEEIVLSTAQEVNNLIGGYAITVHKAQGSEWERVFFIMHNSHQTMNQRELLYTAVTRARSFLYMLCETDTLERGVQSQRIPGNTLEEKMVHFRKKHEEAQKKLQLVEEGKAVEAPKRMVKLSEIIPDANRSMIVNRCRAVWEQALVIFKSQANKMGNMPEIDFELASRRMLGRAKMHKANPMLDKIQFNPVWLSVEDAEVLSHFTNDTVPHEICHIIAYRLYNDAGHGYWWKQVMKQMGVPAHRISQLAMPPYLESKTARLAEVFKQFDVGPDLVNSEDDSQIGD